MCAIATLSNSQMHSTVINLMMNQIRPGLVFKSPVRSGYWVPMGANRDRVHSWIGILRRSLRRSLRREFPCGCQLPLQYLLLYMIYLPTAHIDIEIDSETKKFRLGGNLAVSVAVSLPLAVAHQAPALHNTVLTTILSLLIRHVNFRINNILL